jgi:fibro-slime domain-containing protein
VLQWFSRRAASFIIEDISMRTSLRSFRLVVTTNRFRPHPSSGLVALLGGVALTALSTCTPGKDVDRAVSVVGVEGPEEPAKATPGAPMRTATEADLVLVEAAPPPFCGDGALNDDEQCDDGNTDAADGCSSNCLIVEQGYACAEPGKPCELAAICGDGLQILDERCDDGNVVGGDGCASNCQIEKDYACPEPGKPCVSAVECGDGRVSGDEQCDDANTVADDGCSATCQIEAGWACPIPGALCVPTCGDGLLRGLEQCDDGNAASPGCSASCGREDGFVCDTAGEPCRATVCGDGVREGSEGCDDGPGDVPFDGCFQCVREPTCVAGECGAQCGDGLRYDSEACDDGNLSNGDGCSDICTIEPGFACVDQGGNGATGGTFVLPVIYRDFVGIDTSGDPQAAARVAARAAAGVQQHPQFNSFAGTGVLGAVAAQLGADGRPVLATTEASFVPAARFNQWYRDDTTVNLPVIANLTLTAQGDGSFVFDSAIEGADGQFDPLLGLGFQAPPPGAGVSLESPELCARDLVPGSANAVGNGTPRNMSFTTETHFVFEYAGGETFAFSGDDDVWVFVNNRLVVDLGGLHEIATGDFKLDDAGVATVNRAGPPGSALTLAAPITINTGMVVGNVYEAVLFHAERHECGSNFKLTLAGFDKPRSVCREVCGDNVVTRSESCDQGELNGTGYGVCSATCTPGPRCGDSVVDESGGEACDNGLNVDRYSTSSDACGPGCKLPSVCGDAVIDSSFGEQCDDGKNDDSYGGCSPQCKLGPRCADGIVNGPEECDDGNRVNGDGCNLGCKIERDVR